MCRSGFGVGGWLVGFQNEMMKRPRFSSLKRRRRKSRLNWEKMMEMRKKNKKKREISREVNMKGKKTKTGKIAKSVLPA